MLKRLSFLLLLNFVISILLLPGSLLAQITQDHPELCGNQGAVPLPSDLTVVTDRSLGQSTLVFSGGKDAKVPIPGVMGEVQEVCPLSSGRVLIFGVASSSLYNIVLADISTRQITDSFHAYTPAISPDQHWLIMRKFYPTGGVSENISEEYLLYDLRKSPGENRATSIIQSDRTDVGHVVYPIGQNNLTGDNIGVPANQAHEFHSTTFFWDPDSTAVIFADSVSNQFSIVLVTVGRNGSIATYVHSVHGSDLCVAANNIPAMLTNVDFVSGRQLAMQVALTSSESGCASQVLPLQLGDFTPPTTERHNPKHGKPWVLKAQQP